MKWRRIRPGLYELWSGKYKEAVIERGGETGLWWIYVLHGMKYCRRVSLRLAKEWAEKEVARRG